MIFVYINLIIQSTFLLLFDISCSLDITLATIHTITSFTSIPHHSTGLYSNSNNKRVRLSEPIHNQYRHSAIITTTTTPIERASTATASHLTESSHKRSISIVADIIEHTNTLSNG
jgi:hypothetical protein